MKLVPVLLAVSLAANVGLLAWVLRRGETSPEAARAMANAKANLASATAAATTKAERERTALVTALAAGDAATLKAAGVSEDVIRHLAAARAFARMVALEREKNSTAVIGEFWRRERRSAGAASIAKEAERHAAERELERALREAFGDRWMVGGDGPYGFLPAEKQEKLRRIERDYEEMQNDLALANHGLELAADRQKRELLNAEKERDLAAVLTPAERAQVERRNSSTAQEVINRYGDVLASEEEFSRVEALQRDFNDHFNTANRNGRPRTPEENRARAEAEARLNDEVRSLLGEDRWAVRDPAAAANERETVRALATRLGLGATTADGIFALRDNYAAQSLVIQQNPTLSVAERSAQLSQLAARARDELAARLGPDGAEAYVKSSGWVQTLQRGNAFVTDPRQLPPGSPRPGSNSTWLSWPPPKR